MKASSLTRTACLTALLLAPAPTLVAENKKYLKAAESVVDWLTNTAIRTDRGVVWAVEPDKPKVISSGLYSGTSGVLVFLLDYYNATLDDAVLDLARRTADHLLATLPSDPSSVDAGLYTGVAGIGFVLQETHRVTGEEKYAEGVGRVVDLLQRSARPQESGKDWNGVSDIIGGSAGTGLFLIYAARETKSPEALELASSAGDHLIETAVSAEGGKKWAMNAEFPRLMPNFSHGTAGVAYFLASLYLETQQKRFLDAAVAGARYLQAIADQIGEGCLIFHHEPGGQGLYYLSWCHGPAGTARLFYRLFQATDDPEWMGWVRKLSSGVRESGIPERSPDGYWNNVGQCCGGAGVADFFLNLYEVDGKQTDLQFAVLVADSVISKSTVTETGTRWVQAEHRVKPELLAAQTGFMQGAAGVGVMLLRLQGIVDQRKRDRVRFPDSPF